MTVSWKLIIFREHLPLGHDFETKSSNDGFINYHIQCPYCCNILICLHESEPQIQVSRCFLIIFSRRTTGFYRHAKLFELNIFIENSPIHGQTSLANSSSQPVNFPGTRKQACTFPDRIWDWLKKQ